MTGLRRLCAALLILGAVAPSSAGAAIGAHELFDHGSFAAIDPGSLAALFHGHRHSSNAPDHDHQLFAPLSSVAAIHPPVPQKIFLAFFAQCTPMHALTGVWLFEKAALATGSGPPLGISPLRV